MCLEMYGMLCFREFGIAKIFAVYEEGESEYGELEKCSAAKLRANGLAAYSGAGV